ncbi:MAG: phosphotransferase [Magnetococcales bacterium]|nr:phosphotransferase [Magnetococcales bacterium]
MNHFSSNQSVDERGVSWKIVLDVPPRGRVLALGLGLGELLGLARTWDRVDGWDIDQKEKRDDSLPEHMDRRIRLLETMDRIDPPYHLIVVGRMVCDLWILHAALADGGFLACLGFRGCSITPGKLKKTGFQSMTTLAAVPPRQPRLFFPQEDRFQRRMGLSFHAPGRPWLGGLVSGLRFLVGAGWPVYPGWQGVLLARKSADPGVISAGFIRFLGEKLRGRPDYWVIYAGSGLARRKMTILVGNRQTGDAWIAKLADSPAGVEALHQESRALAFLSRSALSRQIPAIVIDRESWMGHEMSLQTMVGRSGLAQVTRWTGGHGDFLLRLAGLGRHVRPLGDTACWRRLVAAYEGGHPWPERVHTHFSHLLQEVRDGIEVPCCFVHGDFAPWNLRFDHGIMFVIDWEESEPDGLATTDLFHFFYSRLGRKQGFGPEQLFARFGQILAGKEWQWINMHEGMGTVIRSWLLQRFLCRNEPQALESLSLIVPGEKWPWKKG